MPCTLWKTEKKYNRRYRIAKSRKIQNTWRKCKLQILGNIESGQKSRDKFFFYLRRTRKLLESRLCSRIIIKRNKHRRCPLWKLLRTILKINKGRTQKNEPKYKKGDDDVQGLSSERGYKQSVCVQKRGRKSTRKHWRERGCIRFEEYIKKAKTNHSGQ